MPTDERNQLVADRARVAAMLHDAGIAASAYDFATMGRRGDGSAAGDFVRGLAELIEAGRVVLVDLDAAAGSGPIVALDTATGVVRPMEQHDVCMRANCEALTPSDPEWHEPDEPLYRVRGGEDG